MTAEQCDLWTQQLRTRGIRAVSVEQQHPRFANGRRYCIVVPAPSGNRPSAYVLTTRSQLAAVLNLRQPKGCTILSE